MKILYIAPCLPHPPDKGERIRSFHQVRHLARRHEVHLACLTDGEAEAESVRSLEQLCASVRVVTLDRRISRPLAALAFLRGESFSIAAFDSRRFRRALLEKIRTEGFDCVLAFSSVMAPYALRVSGVPRIVDFVDLDSELWRQTAERRRFPAAWLRRLEAERLARNEAEASRASDGSIFASPREAELLRRRAGGHPVAAVTNGVDLEFFAPRPPDRVATVPPTALFIGTMNYEPNVDAVRHFHRDILPVIRRRMPEVTFSIVGRRPTREVRRLARDPRVIVTGSVRDVRPYLERAGVAVAPFRLGTGIQNKILEAMASGVPVVGTSLAFRGLNSPEAAGLRVADDPTGFANEVVALLTDPALRRECVRRSRLYVERNHRWEDHGAELERLLREAMGAPPVQGRPVEEELAK